LGAGLSRYEVALRIAESPEAGQLAVVNAYRDLLGREPDPAGAAALTGALGEGLTKSQLWAAVAASPEYLSRAATGASGPAAAAPVVDPYIVATGPTAYESNQSPGVFTVYRTGGDPYPAFTVHYSVSGTATNGVDYQTLSGSLTIPSGASSANLLVSPLLDSLVEGNETVTVTLLSDPSYVLSAQTSATVTIVDYNPNNLAWASGPTFTWSQTSTPPPSVTNPGARTSAEGAAVSLQINATDPNNYPLTYDAVNLPPGLTINSRTGLISGTVGYQVAEAFGGSYPVTVTVGNDHGGNASQTFTWTVTDTPLPASLTNPGNQTNAQGDTVSLQVNATQPDGDGLV
jgi:hypothetical protein